MNNESAAREVIKYYLLENKVFNEKELSLLSTDSVNDSIRSVAKAILASIIERSASVDTSAIDASKGDVKQLPNLESLQDAINKLESIVDSSSEEGVEPELVRYLKEIERALMNLNRFSIDFRDAYKNRKTLLILKYQSLVMSVFSAVSYLISVMIDFSTGKVRVRKDQRHEEIAPLKAIFDFNKSVERGDFKKTLKDVALMRESFTEVSKEQLELLEGYDLSSILMDGIKTVYNSFSGNPKLMEFLYKAAGIITLLVSLREVFYMFFKAKTKVEDIIGHIDNFAQAATGKASATAVAKLNSFSDRFVRDSEEASAMARREIETENRELGSEVREIPQRLASASEEELKVEEEKAEEAVDTGFTLDF
jgi:hypothetical protein